MKVFFYDFFTEIKKCIFKKKWFVISIAISFVLGIILGIVLDKGITETYFNNESVIKYYTKIYSDEVNPVSTFFSRFGNNLIFAIILVLCSISVLLSPFQFIIFIYRGFILSSMCVIMITEYGFNGIFITLTLFIPQTIISNLGLMIISIYSYNCECLKSLLYDCYDRKKIVLYLLLLFIFSLLGALIELLIVLLIIRPLNFNI